jgi:hypothetical protein
MPAVIGCAAADCSATHPDHAWGKIHAHGAGWFTQKNGTAWCPDHVPEWVTSWRQKR